MNQRKILDLLFEARDIAKELNDAIAGNTPIPERAVSIAFRINTIHCLLSSGLYRDNEGGDPLNSRAAGLQLVLDKLFVNATEHNPDSLLALFPVFAMLCGDRPADSVLANPEWGWMRIEKAELDPES